MDYDEPRDHPEDDDIVLNVCDKFIQAQMQLDDGKNAMVKRQLTNFHGPPIGIAHTNSLLNTCQYEELDDGTTNAYCADIITEKMLFLTLMKVFVMGCSLILHMGMN